VRKRFRSTAINLVNIRLPSLSFIIIRDVASTRSHRSQTILLHHQGISIVSTRLATRRHKPTIRAGTDLVSFSSAHFRHTLSNVLSSTLDLLPHISLSTSSQRQKQTLESRCPRSLLCAPSMVSRSSNFSTYRNCKLISSSIYVISTLLWVFG
jgi:hypothetical protein